MSLISTPLLYPSVYLRWAILCLKWQLAVRRTRCEQQQQQSVNQSHPGAAQPMLMISDRQHGSTLLANNNNHPNLPANGLTKTAGLNSSSGGAQYTNYNTLIAWGIPALQTVAVLLARFVDADELLGEIDIVYCVCSIFLIWGSPLARRLSGRCPLLFLSGISLKMLLISEAASRNEAEITIRLVVRCAS